MNEIHVIHGTRLILPFAANLAKAPDEHNQSAPQARNDSDRLEVSTAGAALAAASEATDIRIEKVARVRSEVQNGIYDVEGKLESVLDRILNDLG